MKTEAAARLVSLYPRRWRARYGDEFALVLREQRLTLKLTLDVVGGAVDARLRGGNMTGMMKRCSAGGPQLSTADAWRAAWTMIGASLAFSGLYILAKLNLENEELVDAFGIMAYPAALVVTMPFYYMKDHSGAAKAVVVGGSLAVLAGLSYLSSLL